MTIEKEAIQHIQKTANMVEMNERLQAENTHFPLFLTPEGFKINNLESYMQYRSSFRFDFRTKSIVDFAVYSEEFDQEGAKCFVDSDNMQAKIIFDIGTEEAPLQQDHSATLKLQKTSAYSKLLSVHGDHMEQRTASDFIEDYADFITVEATDGKAMTIAQAANAINKITIETAKSLTSEIGDLSSSLSAMEKEEIKGASRFPSKIHFQCVPFMGLDKREFSIRVGVLTSHDRPRLALRVLQLEPHQESIAEEFKDRLIALFDKKEIKTFIGTAG